MEVMNRGGLWMWGCGSEKHFQAVGQQVRIEGFHDEQVCDTCAQDLQASVA